jgi:hypothetical protein
MVRLINQCIEGNTCLVWCKIQEPQTSVYKLNKESSMKGVNNIQYSYHPGPGVPQIFSFIKDEFISFITPNTKIHDRLNKQ